MDPKLPWYIAGPLIGLIVPLLLYLRQKQFGMSSSLSFLAGQLFPKKEFFKSARINANWQFHFGLGVAAAGLSSSYWLTPENLIISDLAKNGSFLVQSIYSFENAFQFLCAGILIGFGARCANGCTAGNCIMGISQFSKSSIVATVAFFIAGTLTAWFINPFIY